MIAIPTVLNDEARDISPFSKSLISAAKIRNPA
jgi:hypothetical protein